jgi:hypothetical protein
MMASWSVCLFIYLLYLIIDFIFIRPVNYITYYNGSVHRVVL